MSAFWSGMAAHLWQTTIVLAVIATAAWLLRRAPARWTALLWSTALLKLFLPLQLFGPVVRALLDSFAAISPGGGSTAGNVWIVDPVYLYLGVSPASSGGLPDGLFAGLTVLWIGGAGGIGLLVALRHRRPRPIRGLDGGSLSRRLLSVARAAGIPPDRLTISDAPVLPSVRGLWSPRIVVPARLVERLEKAELRGVLLHEEAHCRRRDPLRSLLMRITSALFWFYFPVWWVVRQVHDATESACDEAALTAGVDPQLYRRALARTVCLGLAPEASPVSIRGRESSRFARRLRRLSAPGRIIMTHRHRASFATALFVVALSTFLPLSLSPSPAALAGEGDDSPGTGLFAGLDGLADAELPIQLNFDGVSIERILEAIEEAAPPLELRCGEPFRAGQRISIAGRESPLAEALVQLGITAGLRYEVIDPYTVIVRSILVAGKDGVTSPVLIQESKVEPAYPEEMRRQGVAANVILQAVIDELGRVSDVLLLRNSKPEHAEFVESAVSAVEQWRYEPATLDGKPVQVYFTVFIQFRLDDGPDS